MSWRERPCMFADLPAADRFTKVFYSLWAFHMNCGIESPFSRKWLKWPAKAVKKEYYKAAYSGDSEITGSYPTSPAYQRKWAVATFQRNNYL